jgi:hypothetical protein
MDKIRLDRRVTNVFDVDLNCVKASDEQMERIESLSKELTEVCDL